MTSDDNKLPSGDPRTTKVGFWLLLVFLPLGMTLEALHALRLDVYFGSDLRQQLWRLAHAHGNLLGILCLVYGGLSHVWFAGIGKRRRIGQLLCGGAAAMPVGFLLGGVANSESDPSLFILLVPLGGLSLMAALLLAALHSGKVDPA